MGRAMRKELKKREDFRGRFSGVFVRYGTRKNWHGFPEKTLLLRNVRQGDEVVADHIWFAETKQFAMHTFEEDDLVEFDARVKPYEKGYVNNREWIDGRETDYRLSHPTKVVRYGKSALPTLG